MATKVRADICAPHQLDAIPFFEYLTPNLDCPLPEAS